MRPIRPGAAAAWPLILTLLLSALLAAGPAAATAAGPAPRLDAKAWILLDARDGSKIAGQAASRQLPIASTTKLMTAFLALRRLPLDRELVAPAYAALPAESVLGLVEGERISVRDLLVAMMLPSANDAAYTIAEGVSGSVPRFVRLMNASARRLGLRETSYANPIGLDDPDNGSSARDLGALTLDLLGDRRFRRIVAKPEATLRSGSVPRTVQTRNTLILADRSVDGVKTGHTLGAGYVLVASARREGVPLVSVVLGAPSEAARDQESERLLGYGFSLYRSRTAVRKGELLGTVPVAGGGDPLELRAGRSERVRARADQALGTEIEGPAEIEGPIAEGQRIGRAAITLDGASVGSVAAVAATSVAEPGGLGGLGTVLAVVLIVGGSILILIAFAFAIRGGSRAGQREPGPERTPEASIEVRGQVTRRRGQKGNGA